MAPSKYDKYFVRGADNEKCRICDDAVKRAADRSTASMRHHLQTRHPEQFNELTLFSANGSTTSEQPKLKLLFKRKSDDMATTQIPTKKMSPSATKQEIDVRDIPLSRVVVYNDRAEVKRCLKTTLQPGLNEVHVTNISRSLYPDSLRVEGRGNAKIHDVQEKVAAALRETTDSPKVSRLRTVLEKKEVELRQLNDKNAIVQKRIEVLDKIVGEVGSGVVNPPKESGHSFVLDETTLNGLTRFFNFYDDNSTGLRDELRKVEEEIAKTNREVEKARNELMQAQCAWDEASWQKTAIVTLESTEEAAIELDVVYQVYNANWRPTYDVRVTTGSSPNINITYYGNVSQSTTENWENVPLILSTAQPCLGGNIPELGTLEATFYQPPPPPVARTYAAPGMMMMRKSMASEAVCYDAPESMLCEVASEIRQNVLSTEFKIAREATIPHGCSDHKVTIGIIDVKPQLVHECVPSKNTAAFLTASAVNSTSLAFLAGEASVYLNNAFVAKTHLKDVSPGERFSCSLGVDTAIRVEYKPAKKYHEQSGIINKTSTHITEQTITVKNSRSDQSVLLTVKHHVPRTTDEKIKIRLLNPQATPYDENAAAQNAADEPSEPKEGAKMNAHNNLEWTLKINGGQSVDLKVKWAVEHPKEEKIDYNEKF